MCSTRPLVAIGSPLSKELALLTNHFAPLSERFGRNSGVPSFFASDPVPIVLTTVITPGIRTGRAARPLGRSGHGGSRGNVREAVA